MKVKVGSMLPVMGLLAVGVLGAQTFDRSSTGILKGTYYLRQVLLSGIDVNTGVIGRSRSIIGTATLDGVGNYTFTGTMMDSQSGSAQAYNATGTYGISSNGLTQVTNPITGNSTVNGGVGLGAFVGSSTESTTQDLLVMIPAGTAGVTNNSLLGSYRVGALEFPQGSSAFAREAFFTLTSTGNGTLGNVSVNGSAANLGNTGLTQTATGVSYSLAQTPGTITFPPAGGVANTQLVSGTKTLYVSADGNLLLGGSPGGFDMLLGIRALPAATQPAISGTFFVAGIEEDARNLANPAINSFYGSLNGAGNGTNTWHERFNAAGEDTFDNTFASSVTLDATGAGTKGVVHYDVGANGRALLIVGQNSQYTLALGVHADDFNGSGVFLNPVGIVNAAGFAPITNSVAPNEFITLFGSGLASAGTQVAQTVPLPTTLGGVRVTVNGRPAPLFFVSAQQINALVPSNLPEDYATIQVINNGVSSNAVTVYANNSAPAVFTLPPNGISSAAALHSNFSLVNENSPAQPGETILVYLTGLGDVTPSIPDGGPGPSNPLSTTTHKTRVFFGITEGPVSFSGLAPGFAGLYQLNVQVPSSGVGGRQFLSIDTPDAVNQESTILIAGAQTGNGEKGAAVDTPNDRGYRPARIRKSGQPKSSRESGARRISQE